MKRLLALLVLAAPALAQSVAFTPRGVVVAHDGIVEVFDPHSLQRTSKYDGVEYAGAIVSDDVNVAVLDPLHNRVRILGGEATTTGETPTAGAYIKHELYILERDARTITHRGESVKTGANPLLCAAEGKLYVYSTVEGLFQEITTEPFAVARQMMLPPFATSFVTDAHFAYFTYPSEKSVRTVDVEKMAELGKSKIGRAPIDVALGGHATLLNARVLAVADPTEKIVWLVEGSQSAMLAFSRGFLGGLLGIGVRSALNRAGGATRDISKIESGVDRVFVRSGRIVAYDSATGTLYNVTKEIHVLATALPPRAFALGNDVVYIWQNGTLVAQKTSE